MISLAILLRLYNTYIRPVSILHIFSYLQREFIDNSLKICYLIPVVITLPGNMIIFIMSYDYNDIMFMKIGKYMISDKDKRPFKTKILSLKFT